MAPTPMMQQYFDIKAGYPDAILLFRLGDFYEMFFEDAYKASRVLGLTLTARGKDDHGQKIPMCGIPHHAADNYVPKLLAQNIKVAICEQTEEASTTKGITKREVIKIITPGTISEDSMLSDDNNFLVSLATDRMKNRFGLAYCDISTGEFKLTETTDLNDLVQEVERLSPREVLIPSTLDRGLFGLEHYYTGYDPQKPGPVREHILECFGLQSLETLGLDDLSAGLFALDAILTYLNQTKKSVAVLKSPKFYDLNKGLYLNAQTLKQLEILEPLHQKSKKGSLLWVLNDTRTPMGTRRLKSWLRHPLDQIDTIQNRLEVVDYFFNDLTALEQTKLLLDKLYDLERLSVKLANRDINPKELKALELSLDQIPELFQILQGMNQTLHQKFLFEVNLVQEAKNIATQISTTIVDDPPTFLHQGGFIKQGISDQLDTFRSELRDGKQWFLDYEQKLRKQSGIKTLKVSYNRAFGYYIEVSKSKSESVPEQFIRKQTLVNAERFFTPELKEKEDFILHADELLLKAELNLYDQLIESIKSFHLSLGIIADRLATIDCLSAFAENAKRFQYCRPGFNQEGTLNLKEARHPVVENSINTLDFIPNDIYFDPDEQQFILLTGPNMAGKSTYMRQIALIIVMAQIGSYIPAKSANLCLFDKLFARIGASDNLFEGKSTFMVEMLETANILHNATERSFIILDEIGRGTSTFDGLSIAASLAKYIHTHIKAKTVFATHYHEMTALAEDYVSMKNYNVAVIEEGKKIRFTYRVVPGKAEKSYGIHVAKLAGIPSEVLDNAEQLLSQLEKEEIHLDPTKRRAIRQLSLF